VQALRGSAEGGEGAGESAWKEVRCVFPSTHIFFRVFFWGTALCAGWIAGFPLSRPRAVGAISHGVATGEGVVALRRNAPVPRRVKMSASVRIVRVLLLF
jgi:hypothetical protein